MFVFVIVWVCCVCGRERREGVVVVVMVGGWVGVVFVVPSTVSLRITGAQQLHQVKRMIGGPILKLEICKIQWLLSVNLSEARDNRMCKFR